MAFGSPGSVASTTLTQQLKRGLSHTALAVPAFRRMWIALGLASLGDWMGLLALTALAKSSFGGSATTAGLAITGVFLLRLVPALALAPFAGVMADKLDRRLTIVVTNWLRALILLSIVAFEVRWWLFVATFLMEAASMFFLPAKDAAMPTLVSREKLEQANSINLLTTYGTAPLAALLYAGLALVAGMIDNVLGQRLGSPVMVALLFDAAMFTVAGFLIWPLRELSGTGAKADAIPSVWSGIVQGWRFVWQAPVVRGLIVGMLGAVGAGGVVIPLSALYVPQLGGGDPAFGLLFGTVFVGLALGMGFGSKLFGSMTRRRLFGLAITAAGLTLILVALIPNIVIVDILALVLGFWAGVAWVIGYTLLGLEVDDQMRGRTFAFIQSLVRVVLVLVMAVAPLLATSMGTIHATLGQATLRYTGVALTMLLAGLLATAMGIVAFVRMDDRRGQPWHAGLVETSALEEFAAAQTNGGFFLALEGGEGSGKSVQVQRLAALLREQGYDVVTTFEPGATALGRTLREVLLDPAHPPMTARAEALLFAADRAENVATVIRPALERGAIVISDRYVDSSLAYQGAGRGLNPGQVLRISRWASEGLTAHLTVVLQVPAQVGLHRKGVDTDRMQQQSLEFHELVGQAFAALAREAPQRYLVVDGTAPVEQVTATIMARLQPRLPLTVAQREWEQQQHREQEQQAAQQRQEREQAKQHARHAKHEDRRRRRQARQQRERAQQEDDPQSQDQWAHVPPHGQPSYDQTFSTQVPYSQIPYSQSIYEQTPSEQTFYPQLSDNQADAPPGQPPAAWGQGGDPWAAAQLDTPEYEAVERTQRLPAMDLPPDPPPYQPQPYPEQEPPPPPPPSEPDLPYWPQPPGGRQ